MQVGKYTHVHVHVYIGSIRLTCLITTDAHSRVLHLSGTCNYGIINEVIQQNSGPLDIEP